MNIKAITQDKSFFVGISAWKVVVGILQFVVTIALIVNFVVIVDAFVEFGEAKISPDGSLLPETIIDFKVVLTTFIIGTLVFNVLLFKGLLQWAIRLLNIFTDTEKAYTYFITDELCERPKLIRNLFSIGTLFGFASFYVFMVMGPPHAEGYVEEYSSWLFLFSGLIALYTIKHLYKSPILPAIRKKILITLLVVSGLLLIVFGEELSWGQRIYGWESTGIFEEYNYQRETNLHNFLNPMFKYMYPVTGVGLLLFVFFMWFFPASKTTYLGKLFIPHQSSFFLFVLIAGSGFNGHSEYFELLLEVFILLYCIRILACLKSPNKEVLRAEGVLKE